MDAFIGLLRLIGVGLALYLLYAGVVLDLAWMLWRIKSKDKDKEPPGCSLFAHFMAAYLMGLSFFYRGFYPRQLVILLNVMVLLPIIIFCVSRVLFPLAYYIYEKYK